MADEDRRSFGRKADKGDSRRDGQQTPSPTSYTGSQTSLPGISAPQMPHSPALSAAMSVESQSSEFQASANRKPPFFFREEYAGLIVKGNFMTLAAKPVHVEEGEWLAHQVVEQFRLLEGMLAIIKVIDDRTGKPICNQETCPTMSAAGHTYAWLDQQRKPIKIPACSYIHHVQKWINGKISDPNLFPTDTSFALPSAYASGGMNTPGASTPIPAGPTNLDASLNSLAGKEWLGRSSGFPENFEGDIKSIYRQMARCYAHIYHGHWLDPFWHINAYKELNTCFIHFVNVGKLFGLIADKEMEPMQPLIDLWQEKGLLPSAQQTGSRPEAGQGAAA
ncbi:protein kinase-like protein activator [Lineolata rhizophorae]|uniref:Protein kinase-like protein activator n=1 Tax=Lineolata rhizophorae TaxID=578093 RepID=A0A6A6PBF0_9PEZI|nr:protein kinase-like protein activator [Lineolata rhizophorae]